MSQNARGQQPSICSSSAPKDDSHGKMCIHTCVCKHKQNKQTQASRHGKSHKL
jgi:hypothetical protein